MGTHFLRYLYLLFAAGALAAEVPVSEPVYAPAPKNQYFAAAATNGEDYLVVWADERSDVPQAYASRISGDGTILDPRGIRVASDALTYYPSVIWGGSSWFVLSNACTDLELVRVAPNGAVLDARPRTFRIGAWCPGVSIATGGRYVAVGYYTGYTTYEERALILDSDGELVADILLSAGEPTGVVPAIASDGSSFIAMWQNHAVRFDRTGLLGPVRDVPFTASAGTVSIATDGRGFLVTSGNLLFRLNAELAAEPAGSLPFGDVKSIHWNGSSYVIAGVVPFYENGHESRSRTTIVVLDRNGSRLGQNEIGTVSGYGAHPLNGAAVASNGRNILMAWHDPTEAPEAPWIDDDLYAAVISLPDLTPSPRKLVSVAARAQLRPATAASGHNQLTIWEESTGLYARRHWRDRSTDPSPLRLATGASSTAVVFNGSDYIVASTEESAVVARRVGAVGELRVERESRFTAAQRPSYVALASDGAVTLVAWAAGGIYAARIGADGSWIDNTPLEVASAPLARNTHRISVSSNGAGEFLIVWGGSTEACNHCSPYLPSEGGPLRAARVTSTLTLLDAAPIEVAVPAPLVADHPSATWNGKEWLVVWNRAVVDANGEDVREEIRGRRIARNGTLLDGTSSDPGVLIVPDGFAPTVAWTGANYVLGWYEGTASYRGYLSSPTLKRIHTASLDRLGGPLSNERVLGEASEEYPVSIAVASGFTTIAYARLGEDAEYGGVSRVFLDVPGFAPRRRTVRK